MPFPLRPGSQAKYSSCVRQIVARHTHTFTRGRPYNQNKRDNPSASRELDRLRSILKNGPLASKEPSSPVPIGKPGQISDQRTYSVFTRLVRSRLELFFASEGSWNAKKLAYQAAGLETQLDFDREAKSFGATVRGACELASQKNATARSHNPLFWSLRNAFVMGDVARLSQEINFSFMAYLMRSRFSKSISDTHRMIADFRFPHEWYPATRALQRTIHLHVGPTNSGKTYRALQALENAKSGIYAGPLRLLAHEVYSRFVAKGKPCALITGEEQRIPENEDQFFRSCTVEMTPLNHTVDVAVIDEIQMIADEERGWAWTQAFLGVQAKEVHLCGEERAVELIQSLCDTLGDKCVIHRYKRLSGLETMDRSLKGGFKELQKGDCIVSFSRVGIHALKRAVQKATGRQCAIVYGSLPPETRAQQAALFNDPDNEYDFLVASDAIGMGLNLEIKRIVFEATHKRGDSGFRIMTTSEIKQIGGRAGRYRTAAAAIKNSSLPSSSSSSSPAPARAVGKVTAFDDDDLHVIQQAFRTQPKPITTAGMQPPQAIIERFSTYFPPNTPFSYIIFRLNEICRIGARYHLCRPKEMMSVADLIQPYPMSIYDRCVFLNAPVALREHRGPEILQAYAKCVSNMGGGALLDIPDLNLELLDADKESYPGGQPQYLRHLEALHKAISLYLWLSYRFAGVFPSQNLAFHVKSLVEAKIDNELAGLSLEFVDVEKRRAAIRKRMAKDEAARRMLGQENDEDSSPKSEGPGQWDEEGHEEPLFEDPSEVDDAMQHEPGTERAGANV